MSVITGDEKKNVIEGETAKNSGGVGAESLNSQANNSLFTPGPWAVADIVGYPTALGVGVEGAEHALAVLTLDSNANPETQMANARLIAAAPTLHDALVTLLDTETNPSGVSGIVLLDAIDKARAALALVNGQVASELKGLNSNA